MEDTTVLENTKKSFGRKTGWCNNPNSQDPESSHRKCDGIWNEKDKITFYCPCECHKDIETKEETKLKNAKKYKKRKIRKIVIEKCEQHPKYTGQRKPRTGCKDCLSFYEFTRNEN